MNADSLDSLTERVLGAIFEVSNTLGIGFLEKVYPRALLGELGLRGIPDPIPVWISGSQKSDNNVLYRAIGKYRAIGGRLHRAAALVLSASRRSTRSVTSRLVFV